MTIYEQIKEAFSDKVHEILLTSEIISSLKEKYGTNPGSIIPSDYCYNRYNNGIKFDKHLFHYINKNTYRYLGEAHPYTGIIYQKPKGQKKEVIVGEWVNGVKTIYKKTADEDSLALLNDNRLMVSKEQIAGIYQEYNNILRLEMNALNCKPTELRHLIGRIGEFICVLHTDGYLSRIANQHGFDVISNNRRISVKTTAQTDGFITINKNTFSSFDDLFVVQYLDDDFNIIFYGPKEEIIPIKREYNNKFEVPINQLKKLSQK